MMSEFEGYPATFKAASKLVAKHPLPDEILEQLRELRDDTPKEFHQQFKMFFHSAMLRLPE